MGIFSKSEKMLSLEDLLHHELRDLYSAESQLIEALPKMEESANDPALKQAFHMHLEETRGQRERLVQIGKILNIDMDGEKCDAMAGLVKEGQEIIKSKSSPEVRDAGLIGAAQRVEHYEIAGYGTANNFARQLGLTEVSSLLSATEDEEKMADEKLNNLAKGGINEKAKNTVRDKI
ncbi:YciE/YciF ferroxidase family protein [Catalinimonas niigatensis]|uniref:YciE/YciF ferroxidase family protein n=1 Tax=Catalinimonas niigatensis TaxID=1397264 RepID=UPI00266678D8|nr:ferritin-like domain-containing protein [Catalinimonas niigatensis]WPP51105.1 ferritin-like domain-containing protein [Catalinimonas niigatensis]